MTSVASAAISGCNNTVTPASPNQFDCQLANQQGWNQGCNQIAKVWNNGGGWSNSAGILPQITGSNKGGTFNLTPNGYTSPVSTLCSDVTDRTIATLLGSNLATPNSNDLFYGASQTISIQLVTHIVLLVHII